MSTVEHLDYGAEAQRAAENLLYRLSECLDIESDGGVAEWPEDMGAPYDGCDTCVVREILYAAWPFFQEAALVDRAEFLTEHGHTEVEAWRLVGLCLGCGHPINDQMCFNAKDYCINCCGEAH